jgi:LacI family transcriptional regulator
MPKTPPSPSSPKPVPPRRGRKNVFIHDVARIAGCSISTVSKALNGTGSLSPKTRKRIVKICEEVGYTPNAAAKALRGRRSENIGILFFPSCIDLFLSPFYSSVAAGAERVLSARNYNFLLAGTEWKGEDLRLPKFIIERSVDGVLLLGKIPKALLESLQETELPFVLLDHELPDPSIDMVVTDNYSGAVAAVRRLLEAGHRRIAMLAAEQDDPSTLARLNGYRSTLLERDLLDPDLVVRGPHSEDGGLAAAEALIRAGKPFTAIFCVNDSMAIGAIKALRDAGRAVPRDVSIIGFDDLHVSRFFTPALTTVRVDQFVMGSMGADILLDKLADEGHAPCKRIVPAQLVERDSVAAPRR